MVLDQRQHVIIFRNFEQRNAQQRALLQIERSGRFVFDESLDRGVRASGVEARLQRCQRDAQRQLWVNHLAEGFALLGEGGAQAFVACNQRIETALKRGDIEFALEAQGAGNVIRGAVRVHLPKEQLTFLGVGQRNRFKA